MGETRRMATGRRVAALIGLTVGCLLGAAAPTAAAVASPTATSTGADLAAVSCPSGSACEAVGSSEAASGGSVPLAEGWNGQAWSIQATPSPPGSSVVYLDGVSCGAVSHCQAVGYRHNSAGDVVSLAERWNGSTWSVEPTPRVQGSSAVELTAVSCPSPSHCEAVGYASTSGGGDAALAERWDGGTWAVQQVPDPGGSDVVRLGGVSCPSATRCEAVGIAEKDAGGTVTLAERWDGTTWSVQTTPDPSGTDDAQLLAVSCASASSCGAVGYSLLGTLTEGWNGQKWSLQPSSTANAGAALLEGVSCPPGGLCQAVGDHSQNSSGDQALALVRQRARWSTETIDDPTGSSAALLGGVSCASSDDCEAVGASGTSAGSATLAEIWNGTTWAVQTTPDPTSATVTAG